MTTDITALKTMLDNAKHSPGEIIETSLLGKVFPHRSHPDAPYEAYIDPNIESLVFGWGYKIISASYARGTYTLMKL